MASGSANLARGGTAAPLGALSPTTQLSITLLDLARRRVTNEPPGTWALQQTVPKRSSHVRLRHQPGILACVGLFGGDLSTAARLAEIEVGGSGCQTRATRHNGN